MTHKHRILWILFDVVLVISSAILISYGIFHWKELGFRIESWSDVSTNEGRACVAVILLGIGLAVYGIFDLFVFRCSKGERGNKT